MLLCVWPGKGGEYMASVAAVHSRLTSDFRNEKE